MLLLAVTLLPLFAFVGVQGACETAGYVQFNSTSPCYSVETAGSFEGKLTWEEANAKCGNDSAMLASIKSKETQAFLNSFLILSRSSVGVWIGLNDADGGGDFNWADSSSFDAGVWENWADNEPPGSVSELCVQMVPDDYMPGLWRTVSCTANNTSSYLCEKDAIVGSTEDPTPLCQVSGADSDYFPYFGYCYKIITTALSYEDAKTQCQETGQDAFLASVRSGYHQNIIMTLMLGAGQTSSWIGLQSSNGLFRWDDGNPLVFTKWGMKEPKLNPSSTTDGCVSINETTGDWFSGDCYESPKSAICAITIDDGVVPEVPEYGECPEGWHKEGYDCFYYVNKNMTWPGAQDECTQLYVDASISVPHGSIQFNWDDYDIPGYPDIWIGVSKNADDKFETVDGSVLNYVNWAEGQPEAMGDDDDCLIASVTEQGQSFWSGQSCDNQHLFFCAFPQITTPRDTGECKSGWFKFNSKCYQHFNERLTFGEARTQCASKAIGGDLASVYNGELQALLTYLMKPWTGGDSMGDVWIGLWDTSNEANFRWTNGDYFGIYENWAPGQPDGYLDFFVDNEDKSDCAKMKADPITPGLWDDVSCSSTKLTYLCECYLDPLLPTPEPLPPTSCPDGYMPVTDSCYRIIDNDMTFDDAQTECVQDGGNLASIQDGYEQGLVQFLLAASSSVSSAWIGINDKDTDGEYTWVDNFTVTYVNWNTGDEPSGGKCVILRSYGFWLESDCTDTHASICKISPIPVTPAPTVSHCDEGWELYEPTQKCYLIDTYSLPNEVSNVYITYADAERSCMKLGSTLVTLHSPDENLWFYIQVRFTLGQRKIWLGMERSVEGLLYWEDGSLVNYVNWAADEPSGAFQGTDCVTLYAGNEGVAEWSDTSCFELNAYACQKDAYPGQAPLCEPGWDFNPVRSNDCYYLGQPEEGLLSWHEAEDYCNQMGSHLASILSFDDGVFISSFLKQRLDANPESWPWVGLRRLPSSTKFTWSDDSVVKYEWWSDDQPDGVDDDCAAIELEGGYNTLNNINCGLRRPFLCKKQPNSLTPITVEPTSPPVGGCSGLGNRIGNKCYELMMEPKSWDDARLACAQFPNGDLASIPIYAVQALMASLFKLVDTDNIWLGMTSKMPGENFVREYHWIDGSSLIFTNWGSGQPSMSTNEDHCVKMLTDPDAPGKWYDDICEHQYAYMCQHDVEPNVTPKPVATLAPCPSGFEGAGSSCFRIETVERTFSNAMEQCEMVDGILAPVMDGFENALIELLMFNAGIESAWLGLQSSEETSDKYEWSSSKWPETYINWANNEPSTRTGCVTTIYSKGWKPIDCFDAMPSICRSTNDIPPTEPPIDPGLNCPENWYAFNNQCYLINTGYTSDSLLNAYFKCSSIGAVPPSIHSRNENLFIRNNVINELTGSFVWLGLVLDQGLYRWMDGTPVDYTNWEDGQEFVPNDGKDCVWMVPEREGRWQRQDCTQQAEVVCMQFEQTFPTTTETPLQSPLHVTRSSQTGLTTGELVAITVGSCLAAFIVILGMCYFCETQGGKQKDTRHLTSHDIESEMKPTGKRNIYQESDSANSESAGKDSDSQHDSL